MSKRSSGSSSLAAVETTNDWLLFQTDGFAHQLGETVGFFLAVDHFRFEHLPFLWRQETDPGIAGVAVSEEGLDCYWTSVGCMAPRAIVDAVVASESGSWA